MENEKNANNTVLDEENLESVTGGGGEGINEKEKYRKAAKAEGRPFVVAVNAFMHYNSHYVCKNCYEADSTYAREKCDIKNGFDEFRDCKCYECGKEQGNINTAGIKVK